MKQIKLTLIKNKRDPTNFERKFEIKCVTAKYQEKNEPLQKRHPNIFKTGEYILSPTKDFPTQVLRDSARAGIR
jgi:hypothetical protein